MPSSSTTQPNAFILRWNELDRRERKRVRRLARLGSAGADAEEASLLAAYARAQHNRPWMRAFWVWFVPGVIMALSIASRLHPILVGIVLALAGQAVFARRNLRRAARAA